MKNKVRNIYTVLLSASVFCTSLMVYANDTAIESSLIPGDTNGLYYRIGGGEVTTLPYAPSNDEIDLDVNGNIGLGYNCGVFNPEMSLMNSFNQLPGSFEHMTSDVVTNAQGALIELPGYIMAKNLPNLYKLMQDGIGNGKFDFNLSTKTCQQMASQIDSGKNPYNDWLQASLGDNWKYHMSLAGTQATSSGLLGATNSDINQVKNQVNKDNGKRGLPWVRGVLNSGVKYAGGISQPTITLTYDTVVAGYNVLIDKNRAYDDTSAPLKTDSNAGLVNTFSDPKEAGKWVAKVVGEQEITTYAGGKKQSIPGIGLLSDVQAQSALIKKKLADLVDGNEAITLSRLKAVSPPKVMLNSAVIQMLRKQSNSLMQAIYVNKIAEEVAIARIIDKAKLGLQLLEVGSQVPSIYANDAAQKGLTEEKERLQQAITDLRNNPKDNEEFVGSTIAALMGATAQEEAMSAAIRPSEDTPANMQNGAIKITH